MKLGHPAALIFLSLLVPLLWLLVREERRRRVRLDKLGSHEVVDRLLRGVRPTARRRQRLLLLGTLVFVVLALAQPQLGESTELLSRRGLDVVFALDVSRSMRARDVLPDRLERAKAELDLLLNRVGENRVGLVAFAGTAFPLCPLTTDIEAARAFLRSAEPEILPQGGTALAEGLDAALQLFLAEAEADPNAADAGRLLVVVTDGEDHEGASEKAAEALGKAGVRLVLIGVGSELGEPIPVVDDDGRMTGYQKDRRGQTIMTRMVPQQLARVADAADGRFINGASRPDLGMTDVEAELAQLEKRDFDARLKRRGIDRSAWPLVTALLCMLGAWIWGERSGNRASQRDFVEEMQR